MEDNLILDTFHSEVVTDEDEEHDDSEDCNPLLHQNRSGPGNARERRKESVKTRVVYSLLQLRSGGQTGSCCQGWRCLSLLLLALTSLAVFFYLSAEVEQEETPDLKPNIDYLDFRQPDNLVPFNKIVQENLVFNISSKTDVMVFLHIQKTGGTTFGKHLVEDIDLEQPCQCHKRTKNKKSRRKFHCDCFRPGSSANWLFSRYSTGWKCGLHPDWTELTACVDSYMANSEGQLPGRRYFYITFLRSPVSRYLSEWRHVARGATWSSAELRCGGYTWADRLQPCYQGEDWADVTLGDFISCQHNLAINRQTRMLADLQLVNCHNSTGMDPHQRDLIMLNSAKANLASLAYFGLTEEQEMSQYLFEETFNLRFKTDFDQLSKTDTHSGASLDHLDGEIIDRIRALNHLDIELYNFARKLLQERFNLIKESDQSYQEHISNIEKEKYEFSWSDIEDEDEDS